MILYPVAIAGASVSANASDPVASNIKSFMVGGNNCVHVNWFFLGRINIFHDDERTYDF